MREKLGVLVWFMTTLGLSHPLHNYGLCTPPLYILRATAPWPLDPSAQASPWTNCSAPCTLSATNESSWGVATTEPAVCVALHDDGHTVIVADRVCVDAGKVRTRHFPSHLCVTACSVPRCQCLFQINVRHHQQQERLPLRAHCIVLSLHLFPVHTTHEPPTCTRGT